MAQLTASKVRDYGAGFSETHNDVPILAATKIFEGSAVGLSAGYARQLVAGDKFVGFATRDVDNSAGASGDRRVRVRKDGSVMIPVTGVTGQADLTKQVAMSDGDTATLTLASNSKIGHVIRFESGTLCQVEFHEQET